jgi:hypothetical protein
VNDEARTGFNVGFEQLLVIEFRVGLVAKLVRNDDRCRVLGHVVIEFTV